jgi:SNF2 family DNA or RNA helicase
LVSRGTVDEKIIKALRSKKNVASLVLGDEWRQWI